MRYEESVTQQGQASTSGETTPTPGVAPAAGKRRRLLAGALGTPLLLTVPTGSATAASSALTCLTNAKKATTSPTGILGADDNWFRTPCDSFTLRQGQSGSLLPNNPFVLSAPDGMGVKYYVSTVSTTTRYAQNNLPSGVTATKTGSLSCLVYVNDNGQVAYQSGVFPNSANGGAAIGDTCWASIPK